MPGCDKATVVCQFQQQCRESFVEGRDSQADASTECLSKWCKIFRMNEDRILKKEAKRRMKINTRAIGWERCHTEGRN
jgi:hypothetical protein